MKLPGHRPGLPGKVISFHIVPLDPSYKSGLAEHVPVSSILKIFRKLSRTNGSHENADPNSQASIIFSAGSPGLGLFWGAFLDRETILIRRQL